MWKNLCNYNIICCGVIVIGVVMGIIAIALYAIFKRYQLRDKQFKQRFIDALESEEFL